MLDGAMRKLIDPPLDVSGARLAAIGIGANQVTLIGLAFGLAAGLVVATGNMGLALVFIVLSRLADGLDGAIARATEKTDFGGFLDIVSDFAFYGAVPFGFVLHDPAGNAVAGAFLLFSFYVNAASFLGYAVLAERRGLSTEIRGEKTLYFTAGLMEGTETVIVFAFFCLWPNGFAQLASVFALLVFVTAAARAVVAYQRFAKG